MTINSVTKVYGVKLLFSDFLKKIGKECDDEEEFEMENDYKFQVFEKGTVLMPSEKNKIPDTLMSFIRTHDIDEAEKKGCAHIVIGLIVSHNVTNRGIFEQKDPFAQDTPYTQSLGDIVKIVKKYKELSKKHEILSGLKRAFYTIYDDCFCCS